MTKIHKMKIIISLLILLFIFSCKKDSATIVEENIILVDGLKNIDTIVKPIVKTPNIKNYKTYCNDRFQFCIEYPLNFKPQGESFNGDGQVFKTLDEKAQITVYGSLPILDVTESLEQLYQMTTNKKIITYKVFKKNYFIISYYDEEGNIVYEKTIFKKINDYLGNGPTDVFQTLMITYPKNQSDLYDSYCEKIVSILK